MNGDLVENNCRVLETLQGNLTDIGDSTDAED